ncbi:MAG: ISNCY family transposase [Proteobacteria bacterium]|nr:ISNCY family transposase [Pseudomonadota bacterium]MCH8098033.1 ISNCY family transposase [Pseudomonadota bacterium]
MNQTVQLQGLRLMRFEHVLARWSRRELSQAEAGELLGMSERTFRRWRDRHEDEGLEGLYDRRLGKASTKRVPVDEIERVLTLYRDRYCGFTVKHFHEKLEKHHDFRFGYTWTKTTLQGAGLVKKAPRRGAHRKKRPRRPMPGMLVHQDGSSHRWIPGLDQSLDLIVTMDDAGSEIYSAFLVEEEGTLSSFSGLSEVIAAKGLPCAFYTDRASHYFHTPEAGGKVDKAKLTQVGRALAQLGIEHIPAYSPEARGRSERAFGTLQDRLPKELKLAGIATVEAANRFIKEVYVPEHNARFAVPPEQPGSAFVPDRAGAYRDILCIHEERTVGNDNTVRYRRLYLQLPESPLRPHFVKAKVRVHEYPDGHLAVFHGPRRLACYGPDGTLIEEQTRAAA